jgi:tRNA threonylcarbamoyl adenosine modification protein (Sua5/YciO/YrdC/YwlC family)
MLIKIYPENPAPRHIKMLAEVVQKGEIIIFPTDTIYAMGCDLYHPKAIEQIEKIKGIKKGKANLSLLVKDLSMLSKFVRPIDNSIFRLIKKNTPGPFTFILNANSQVPKLFQSKKKTIGIRIPSNNILLSLIEQLGSPLVTTSLHDEDTIKAYPTDPELIHENFSHLIDYVVDGGYGSNEASTVVDCTSGEAEIIRQGQGKLFF